jgi:hypothetical protein
MLCHARGAPANKGHDTRALQACLDHRNIQHMVRYTELSPDRFRDFCAERAMLRGWHLFRLALERRARIVAAMGFLDNALTLITLVSLFLLGPALGRALVACFENWQGWSLPIQHLAVGICTMIAVTAMVLAYGALWKLVPSLWLGTAGSRKCQWPAM